MWQYKTVPVEPVRDGFVSQQRLDAQALESRLNEFGEQGWELMTSLNYRGCNGDREMVFVFKRPLGLAAPESIPELNTQYALPTNVSF